MPLFDFEAPDGTRHERYYGIGKAPKAISVKGVRCVRVFTSMLSPIVERDMSHVASTLPRAGSGIDYASVGVECVRGGVENGKPILKGMRDIKNVEALTGYVYDHRTERARPWEIRGPVPGAGRDSRG